MTDLRQDGAAALDWVARYLERVGELPVLARVKPGDVRGRLPSEPPEEPEPFANVLRDLDELLLPAVTHWQHPRYFAYFATSASEPAILAELLSAALNPVAILWRTPEFRQLGSDPPVLQSVRARSPNFGLVTGLPAGRVVLHTRIRLF